MVAGCVGLPWTQIN